jgi:predicted SAM-dependent methyltransferase
MAEKIRITMLDHKRKWNGSGHEPHCPSCQNYVTSCTCLIEQLPNKPVKLNLGCRTKPLPTYINVDIDPLNKYADVIDDALKLEKFADGSVDVIEAVHMFEHLSQLDTKDALKLWHRKLKNGGTVRLSVPDMEKCSALLLLTKDKNCVKSMFYGSQRGDQWDYHKSLHTKESLAQDLVDAGFAFVHEWDWRTTWPHNYIDTYASAYFPDMRKDFILDNGKSVNLGGVLMSLNLEGKKL